MMEPKEPTEVMEGTMESPESMEVRVGAGTGLQIGGELWVESDLLQVLCFSWLDEDSEAHQKGIRRIELLGLQIDCVVKDKVASSAKRKSSHKFGTSVVSVCEGSNAFRRFMSVWVKKVATCRSAFIIIPAGFAGRHRESFIVLFGCPAKVGTATRSFPLLVTVPASPIYSYAGAVKKSLARSGSFSSE